MKVDSPKSCFQFFSILKLATASGNCSYTNTVLSTVDEWRKAEPGSGPYSLPFTYNIHVPQSQRIVVHKIFMGVNQELPCKVRSRVSAEVVLIYNLCNEIKNLKTRKSCALNLTGRAGGGSIHLLQSRCARSHSLQNKNTHVECTSIYSSRTSVKKSYSINMNIKMFQYG